MYLDQLRDILEFIIDDPETVIEMIQDSSFWTGRYIFGGYGTRIRRNDVIKVLKELGKRKIKAEDVIGEVDEMIREGYRKVIFRGDRWKYYY
jgi:hypothetical protein